MWSVLPLRLWRRLRGSGWFCGRVMDGWMDGWTIEALGLGLLWVSLLGWLGFGGVSAQQQLLRASSPSAGNR